MKKFIFVLVFLTILPLSFYYFTRHAIIVVDVPYPTETKSQSKLWYFDGFWWVWLPTKSGSKIWKRVDSRWVLQKQLAKDLSEVPGYPDVFSLGSNVYSVLVDREKLNFVHLEFNEEDKQYKVNSTVVVAHLPINENSIYPGYELTKWSRSVESSTISVDPHGYIWIVYDYNNSIWAIRSEDKNGTGWGVPFNVSEQTGLLGSDDISVSFSTNRGIGVAWSNQRKKSIFFRLNEGSNALGGWNDTEVILHGDKLVNDHLNAAIGSDGTIYLVSKTSKYIEGHPVLAVHRKVNEEGWETLFYADYIDGRMPTRPIAVLSEDSDRLILLNELLDSGPFKLNQIVSFKVEVANENGAPAFRVQNMMQEVIARRLDQRNATSTKQNLPKNEWVILSSDRFGNVYEGIVR